MTAGILCLAMAGCGLVKRGDATDPASLELKTLKKFADSLEPQSSLSRSSGEVTYLRLNTLFPKAGISRDDFTLLGGQGLNRAFGEMERPVSALAQVALRTRASTYCKSEIELADRSNVFSPKVLASGESLPQDAAVLAAFTAARNIWLDLYTADSPEVQELARLYTSVVGESTEKSPDLEAKRAVCEAALIAPQFWIGNSSATDVIRRVALEIGRRLPAWDELRKFRDGQLTLGDYTDMLQKEPGYLQALHGWNEEWLGLRTFLPLYGADLRGGGPMMGAQGSSLLNAIPFSQNGTGFIAPGAAMVSSEVCNGPAGQTFDPDTKYVVWEQDTSTSPSKVFFLGGYVRPDSVADFKTNYLSPLIATTYPDMTADTLFGLLCLNPGDTTSNPPNSSPDWYMCNGLMPLSQADQTAYTAAETDFTSQINYYTGLSQNSSYTQAQRNYYAAVASTVLPKYRSTMEARVYNTNYYRFYLSDVTNLFGNGAGGYYTLGGLGYFNGVQNHSQIPSSSNFKPGGRRMRRFAPSGEQNGKSTIQLYWSGQSATVCNNAAHFAATCFYRPAAWPGYGNPLVFGGWTPAKPVIGISEANFIIDSLTHPDILKDFRCGPPVYKSIVAGDPEDTAYPKGSAGDTNMLASTISLAPAGNQPEGVALSSLWTDLYNEPYNLIDYVVTNDLDFTEILTADYSCGGATLEKYYKTQGYWLPTDPSNFESFGGGKSCATAPSGTQKIFSMSTPIPYNLVKSRNGTYSEATLATQVQAGEIQPKVMSGILTMPAFLGPVSPKMRTISSRYWQRLMCGDPNLFVPSASEDAMQAQYISQSSIHKGHLRTECRQCHINLDPLAAALSANFVQHEGDVSPASSDGNGELVLFSADNTAFFGIRGGGPKGQGALLGQPASGVHEVAQILSTSEQFNHCVVQKAFENLFGRQIGFADAKFVSEMTTQFKQHKKFNRLIHDMVNSPNFQRRN